MEKNTYSNDHNASRSSANFSHENAGLNATSQLQPPPLQLKVSIEKESTESEASETTNAPYQFDTGETNPIPPENPGTGENPNSNSGLPFQLKSGIEQLSGLSMNDVNVHYNSSKPAQLKAHAYAQGSDIHIGPGQEKHLPHEAWHIVQQKQGRVNPTAQLKSFQINDDQKLESEADVMGAKAMQLKPTKTGVENQSSTIKSPVSQLKEVSEEELEEGTQVADDMIDDAGGAEAIDELFGSGFSDRFHDLMISFESGELNVENVHSLNEEDQIYIQDELWTFENKYLNLYNYIYDETGKEDEDVDWDNVSAGLLLLDELEIRADLLYAISQYYQILHEQGFFKFIPSIVAFCKLFAAMKCAIALLDLEKKLEALQEAVEKAESNLTKAAAETGVDLAIGAVAIGLTAAGMMTPGVNIAIFLGGVVVGQMLSTEDSTTKIVQTGVKGSGFAVSKALENSKKFKGHVTKIKSIGPGLDLILNSAEAIDKYQELALLQTALKDFEKFYDTECKNLEKDLEKQFEKFEGMAKNAEEVYENNWDQLEQIDAEISSLYAELGAFE